MTDFWRTWLNIWCLAVGGFGVVLTLGAHPATDAPVRLLLDILDGPATPELTPHARFLLAVMGPLTLGWCLTLLAATAAASKLDHETARPVWRLISAGVLAWFSIDSILSIATGFWPNLIPNTLYAVAFFIPIFASGVLRRPAPSP